MDLFLTEMSKSVQMIGPDVVVNCETIIYEEKETDNGMKIRNESFKNICQIFILKVCHVQVINLLLLLLLSLQHI